MSGTSNVPAGSRAAGPSGSRVAADRVPTRWASQRPDDGVRCLRD